MVLFVVPSEERFFVFRKCVIHDALANAVHGLHDKMFVMNRSEDFGGDFVSFEEMVEVSACVIFATFAVTFWIYWRKIVRVFGIFDVNASI